MVNNGLSGRGLSVWSFAISGSNIFAGTYGGGVFLSTNNGNSWTAVNNGLSVNGLYVYSFAISGDNLFAGTDGGVFLSTNNGSSWTEVNNGLSENGLVVHSLAISGGNIFAGTDGGGVFLSTNNGSSWTAVNDGLSGNYVNNLAINEGYVFVGLQVEVFGNGYCQKLLPQPELEKNAINNSIKIYPNPLNNVLFIEGIEKRLKYQLLTYMEF